PGALLLGELRSRGHPVLRTPRAAAPGRGPQPRGLGGPGSVLARVQQLWLLAGERGRPGGGLLRVRVSRAGGVRRAAGPSGGGVLQRRDARVRPPIRGRAARVRSGPDDPGLLPEHLRGRGGARRVGSGGARVRGSHPGAGRGARLPAPRPGALRMAATGTGPTPRTQPGSPNGRAAPTLVAAFRDVRAFTERLTEGLTPEDMVVQSATEVSPTKWHLAHTSWFFERFVLMEHAPAYVPVDETYLYLFNS